jgi:hypothetical protein
VSAEPRSLPVGATLGQQWNTGRVFRCYSERFGTHDLLCVKCPGTAREDRLRAMEIFPNGDTRELLFYSSVQSDRVEKQWDNLLAYYCDALDVPHP